MVDLIKQLQSEPQVVSVPTCHTLVEVEQAVRQGLVILYLDAYQTYLSIYGTRRIDVSPAQPIEFAGHYRLRQREWHCRVTLDHQTLRGNLQLDTPQSDSHPAALGGAPRGDINYHQPDRQ